METAHTHPLFFSELTHFLRLLPTLPLHLNHHIDHPLTPLLNSYLSHYRLDFTQQETTQAYYIWRSSLSTGNSNNTTTEHTIVQQFWQAKNPKGTVVIAHGYLDHSGLYGRLIQWSLEHHYNVLCMDMPGHGLSSGVPTAIDHFDTYSSIIEQVINNAATASLLTLPLCAIGQSTGCSMLINTLLHRKTTKTQYHFEKIILLAPLVRSYRWSVLRWLYFALRPFLNSISRTFTPSSHDQAFCNFIKYDDPLQSQRIALNWLGAMDSWYQTIDHHSKTEEHPQSLSIIQGTDDRTVDWRYNLKTITSCFPNSQVHYIAQACHHLVGESEEYWQEIENLMNKIMS